MMTPRMAEAGRAKLIELGYEGVDFTDAQKVFEAMMQVAGGDAHFITALQALVKELEGAVKGSRERLSNELDPEIGLPSDYLLRCIHADVEMRGRKNPAFAVSVHHRNIVLSAVARALSSPDRAEGE